MVIRSEEYEKSSWATSKWKIQPNFSPVLLAPRRSFDSSGSSVTNLSLLTYGYIKLGSSFADLILDFWLRCNRMCYNCGPAGSVPTEEVA